MRKWRYLSVLVALAVWQLVGTFATSLPTPVSVVRSLYDLTFEGLPAGAYLPYHLLASLERVLIGFAIAAAVAVPLGVLMGYSRLFEAAVDPLVELVRPIPPVAWVPFAVLWFGLSIWSPAFIIFLGAFFPIVLNTVLGVRSVDPRLVEAARTLGAGRRTVLTKVLIPGAMPSIFTGIRIGLGIGWMSLVAAEMTGARGNYGLGLLVLSARDYADYSAILAAMVVIGLVGFLVDRLIRFSQERLLKWR